MDTQPQARLDSSDSPRSADPFRVLVESLTDHALYMVDPDGLISSWNAGAERIKGYTAGEAIGQPFDLMFAPEDRASGKAGRDLAAALVHGKVEEEGLRSRKDGTHFWAHYAVTPMREGERHIGFGVLTRDITKRKRQEEALRDSEHRLRTALDAGGMGAWSWDIQTDRSVCTQRMSELYGLPPGNGVIDTKVFFDRIHPDDQRDAQRALNKAVDREEEFRAEFRVVLPGGEIRWLAAVGRMSRAEGGRPAEFYGVNHDITERKEAEAAFRRNESLLQMALSAARMGAWSWDIAARRTTYSVELAQLFGMTGGAGTLDRDVLLAAMHPDDRPEFDAVVRRVLEHGELYEADYRVIWPDGTVRWLASCGRVHRDAAGKPIKVLGIAMDVTDRKKAEAALRASEERFRSFMNHTPCQVWIDDEGGVNRFANPALVREIGRPVEEITDRHLADFMPADAPVAAYLEDNRRVLESGKHDPKVVAAPRHDGSMGRFLTHKFPIGSATDGRRLLGGVAIDVTEREQAVEALQASEERFQIFMDHNSAAAWITDSDGKFHFISETYRRMFQLPTDDIIGKTVFDVFPREIAQVYLDNIREVARTGETVESVEPGIRADGSPGEFWVYKFPLRSQGRTLVGGNAIDVTERKRAHDELREIQQRLELATESARIGIYDWNVTKNELVWDKRMYEIYGVPVQEFSGAYDAWQKGLHPEDRARSEAALAAAMRGEGGFHSEFRIVWPNGEVRDIEAHGQVRRGGDGSATRMIGVNWDITERKRAEAELRTSEERFRAFMDHSPATAFIKDEDGRYLYVNQTWRRQFNPEVADWQGKTDHDFWPRATADVFRASDADCLSRNEAVQAEETARAPDGSVRTWLVMKFPLVFAGRRRVGGMAWDITDRKRAEEGMRLRDRAIEAVAQGIVIADVTQPDYPVVYASPSYLRITGYTNESVLSKSCQILFGPKTDADEVAAMTRAVASRQSYSGEMLCYRKDGTTFWDEVHLNPFYSDDRVMYYIGVHTDVTARRSLESQLQQSQKMEAVGRLAGGVAHDFNNLLTIISGYSDLLMMELPASNPQRGHVVEIRQAGERAAALTRQLLAFSRQQVIQPVVLDLNDVVGQTERMLRRLLGEDIAMASVLSPTLPRVKADPGQVDQVIMNLCVNARDAMPTGGRLTIETSEFVLEGEQSAYPDLPPGRYAQLSVTDTGHGMTEQVKAQIFEPFFTTKEPGKGTGLGLATVFGIVKQSNGRISVYSEVGVGTTFKILFPAVDAAPSRVTDGRQTGPLRGTETILLVEDEAGVRKVARISLESQGYKVLEAVGGADAIAKADQHPGPIHLVLTDVVMPEMGGRQLADSLRARDPSVKVLFMSGYTDDAVIRHGIIEQTGNFLQKPFAPLGLAKKVRAVLDEA